MNSFKFTDAAIKKLKWNGKKAKEIYKDEKMDGLYIVIRKTNIPIFLVIGRIKGQHNSTTRTIGKYGVYTLEQAREEARNVLLQWSKGLNPAAEEKKNRQRGITLSECFADYIKTRTLSEKTAYDYKRAMETTFAGLKDTPLKDITKEKVRDLYIKKAEKALGVANLHFRFLHALFEYAIMEYEVGGESVINRNPVDALKKIKKNLKPRKGIIKTDQLPKFFEVTKPSIQDTPQLRQTKIQCRILLFTGCREQEIASLKVRNINFKDKTITIEKTKNGKELTIPYADFLDKTFKELCEGKAENDYIFPAGNKSGHLKDISKPIKHIRDALGFYFSSHVCRHTFQTYANDIGIQYYVIKQLVNHASGKTSDVTFDYIAINIDTLRTQVKKIESYILQNAGIKQEAEVISFPKIGEV